MATIEERSTKQEKDDAAEVRRHFAEGERVTDPELLKRIRERSEAARKPVFESVDAHRSPGVR
jgi:hypothetical protein